MKKIEVLKINNKKCKKNHCNNLNRKLLSVVVRLQNNFDSDFLLPGCECPYGKL